MKTTSAFLLCAYWGAALWAQNAPKDFYVGLRTSVGTFFLVNTDDLKPAAPVQPRLTFGGGGGAALGDFMTPHFGFEAQLLYSTQGQKYRVKTTGRDSVVSLVLLKVPLLFQYATDRTRQVRFLARLGPQISFLTAASRTAEGVRLSDVVIPPRLKFYDLFNTTDLSIAADVGVDWALNDYWSLQAVFRGEFGLVDAEDRTLKAPGRSSTFHAGVQTQIGLTYTFNPLNIFSGATGETAPSKPPRKKMRQPSHDSAPAE
ncbi:MAG: porin family protein [Bacteroidia bacterium]|nr:porin family protein [Bacteroidia bacterium]